LATFSGIGGHNAPLAIGGSATGLSATGAYIKD
jgi:hypothetical protein